ncbi:unnamed protein product [Cylicostephanus goldi]|uniref:Uncharacterized protein n=1 Tax=Cylicostephanus goldi TaxID=71465 RepID=A0A3P6R6F6_CYLGO|nr:unnamed protein product [Cylicostephanus goldi]
MRVSIVGDAVESALAGSVPPLSPEAVSSFEVFCVASGSRVAAEVFALLSSSVTEMGSKDMCVIVGDAVESALEESVAFFSLEAVGNSEDFSVESGSPVVVEVLVFSF